jgi:hypothetical protein
VIHTSQDQDQDQFERIFVQYLYSKCEYQDNTTFKTNLINIKVLYFLMKQEK